MYNIDFIKKEDFKNNVYNTLKSYNESFKDIDLDVFNKNIIDPIKLVFDKNVYDKSYDSIIKMEIDRQRDKTNNNAIGYFHQNMFKYIKNCVVPREGWDVIFDNGKNKVYVEMKNKHNTMNSSSAQKTYISMQNQIIANPNDYCYLVEVIAKKSQNIPWVASVNKKQVKNDHIRRVSIDQFYKEVTGIENAFFLVCQHLPLIIEEVVNENPISMDQSNSILKQIKDINANVLVAFYILSFESYLGFDVLKQ